MPGVPETGHKCQPSSKSQHISKKGLVYTYGVTAASKRPIITAGMSVANTADMDNNKSHTPNSHCSHISNKSRGVADGELMGAGISAALGQQDDHDTPEQNANGKNLLRGKPADEPPARILSEEVACVYHCRSNQHSLSELQVRRCVTGY